MRSILKKNDKENKLPRPKNLLKIKKDFFKVMKVVILAGGLGTRISEYTKVIPKPMIKICGKPILHRIIDHYIKYGHKDFYIAIGYKGKVIKEYFKKESLKKILKFI